MAEVATPAVRVCEDPDELGPAGEQWDELAVAASRPFSAPAWGLSWWRHLRPERARLRVVLVQEAGRLIGVLPLFSVGRSYKPLGGGLAPVEPLCRPGSEEKVATEAATLLAGLDPAPGAIRLQLHRSSPDWAGLLSAAWPAGRGARRWARSEEAVPGIEFGDFDAWMASKSGSFRREMKRKARRLEEAKGSLRYATEETLERDVMAFLELHRVRLAGRGGTSLGSDGVEAMLVSVGAELLPSGRFRLLCLDLEGRTVAAQLLVGAGREISAWNTGFDEAHAKLSPVMLCILQAVRDAAEKGESTMSLGPGAQAYKYRFAGEAEDSLSEQVLLPVAGAGYPLRRLGLTAELLRDRLRKRLSSARGRKSARADAG